MKITLRLAKRSGPREAERDMKRKKNKNKARRSNGGETRTDNSCEMRREGERIGQKETENALNEKMLPTTLRVNEVKTKMDRRDSPVLETDRNEHVAENKL